MKKYLLIGLFIILTTNMIVLAGVVFNRSGEPSSELTLTERELSFPYSYDKGENSGISLNLHWRTPSKKNEDSYAYSSKEIEISQSKLVELGFEPFNSENKFWSESQTLFWALEFDGNLYESELRKVQLNYQTALKEYESLSNKPNKHKKEKLKTRLDREKISNSRLFFVDVAADYEALASQFSDQKNILIVKGLTKPYFNKKTKQYSLLLRQLVIKKIMISVEYANIFNSLSQKDWSGIKEPRYKVDLKWGKRLEPWVLSINKMGKHISENQK
ncbi:DUF4824 family protein [Pseudoalteromonas denitrificans]|uniref:DUF4824 domain-containing protein n=1 Tax=Pseudoalteromonas denitrificans DSM 6059 TaxID=1123010 RepID=A0A1I1KDJ1_9GAMM|nr:DUF4824 family protein [Pseudoalteromonas denitrificans]SFC58919.1 protein of unknown function [Pseudoalteromonas denitrificans DSM 6059]